MKKRKINAIICAFVMLISSSLIVSCDNLSNMSTEDAYNIGYGAGSLIRVMSGN